MNRQVRIPDTVLVKSRLEPNTAVSVWGEEGLRRQKTKYIGPVVEKDSYPYFVFPTVTIECVPTNTKSGAHAKVFGVPTIQQIMARQRPGYLQYRSGSSGP